MFIDVPDESDLDADTADWFERQRSAWGYLPNYALPFARHVDVARAWSALDKAIRSHMDRRRFELATIAAARAYRSTYCVAAHAKFLRDECGDEQSMRVIAADPTGAALDPTDRAVVDFATCGTTDSTTRRSQTSSSLQPPAPSSPNCSTHSACRPTDNLARPSIPRFAIT
jgi:uncharacterized peroxidase-related enzyme